MNPTKRPPILSVVGKPKVGKTTFLARLIAELTARGYRVGVIKHSVHRFQVAQPGKDTWIHTQAGAQSVAFASAHELVLVRTLEQEMSIDDIAPMLGEQDIVLTEGYKRADKKKIEVSRRALGTDLVSPSEDLVALVCDYDADLSVPQFGLDDAAGVADLVCTRFLLPPATADQGR